MDSIRSPIWVGWLVWTFYGPDRLGYKGGIAPLDLRGQLTDEADTYGWTSRPRALEPAVGVMSRLPHAQGPGQDRWSLHIAGLNNTCYAIRLHRMGQAGRAGLEQVEGRDYRGPSLRGPGSRCAVMGLCRFGRSRPVTHRSFTPIHNSPF